MWLLARPGGRLFPFFWVFQAFPLPACAWPAASIMSRQVTTNNGLVEFIQRLISSPCVSIRFFAKVLNLKENSVMAAPLGYTWAVACAAAILAGGSGAILFICSQMISFTAVAKGIPFRSAFFCISFPIASGNRNMVILVILASLTLR